MKLDLHEKLVMATNTIDESILVNFDVYDTNCGEVVKDGGYVHIRQESEYFNIVIYNCDGDVLSEVNVPFRFKELA